MLKVRIIPTLLFKDHGLVKGVGFDSWRRVGTAMPAIRVYNTRQVDELIFVDITASREGRTIDLDMVDQIADECFMPLTVGGGVRTSEHIKQLLRAGADKVCINTAAIETPEIVSQGAAKFGSQCIVVSVDYKKVDGQYKIFTHSGTNPTDLDPVEFCKKMENLGAGEILLTSIEYDGTMKGYDIEMTHRVSSAVSIPVIASGGAGNYQHMVQVYQKGGASAIAAASIFHFTEQTPLEAKFYLKDHNINVRL